MWLLLQKILLKVELLGLEKEFKQSNDMNGFGVLELSVRQLCEGGRNRSNSQEWSGVS